MRIYSGSEEQANRLSGFFAEYLRPVQVRHGARLVGRWRSPDHRVFAVWEYNDIAHYEAVQLGVSSDPDSAEARRIRATMPPLYDSVEELILEADPRGRG